MTAEAPATSKMMIWVSLTTASSQLVHHARLNATVRALSPSSPYPSGQQLVISCCLAGSAAGDVSGAAPSDEARSHTDAPINDPAREQAVLDTVVAKSTQLSIDPVVAVAVFTDQIEASKAVQYGLYSWWSAHPGQAPLTRPDLGQVRPILDRRVHPAPGPAARGRPRPSAHLDLPLIGNLR